MVDNIFSLPTLLERLAGKLKSYLQRDATNRQEWIEIQEGICLTLAEARDQFSANIEFGQWCEDNGFGNDVINAETRAAAITMGRDPQALRACLTATDRRSLETMYRFEFGRYWNVPKTQPRQPLQPKPPTENIEAAIEAVQPFVDAGVNVPRAKVSEELGIGMETVRRATERARGRSEAREEQMYPPLPAEDMSKTMKKRYEAALRKARQEIREELKVEVYKEAEVYLDYLKDRLRRSDMILSNYQGKISKETFRKIKACLHPDHNTFKYAAEALQAFCEMEPVLVKPDDPVYTGPPLPQTVAELMARRRKR